jgi:polyisoprenoid-binding protein YceI
MKWMATLRFAESQSPRKLTLLISGKGTGSGEIRGKMVFNRKDYGMKKGIPFIKIADQIFTARENVSASLPWT